MAILLFICVFLISLYVGFRLSFMYGLKHILDDHNEVGLSVYRSYKLNSIKSIGKAYIKIYVPDNSRINRIAQILENAIERNDIKAKTFEVELSKQEELEIIDIITNLKTIKKNGSDGVEYKGVAFEEFLRANNGIDKYGRGSGLLRQVNEDIGEILTLVLDQLFKGN